MEFTGKMIAPCGINCAVCLAHMRKKKPCNGCLTEDVGKRSKCSIKHCREHEKQEFTHCYSCGKLPCARIKSLSKRYLEKYKLDLLGNQAAMKDKGIAAFVEGEREKWVCQGCGAKLSVHKAECMVCGRGYR